MSAADIADVLGAMLTEHSSTARVAELDGQADYALWGLLDESGFLTLSMPESAGGGGGTLEEAGAVALSCGRYVAAVPVPEIALVGSSLLEQAGLPIPAGRWTATATPLHAVARPAGVHVSGVAPRLAWARECATLVAPAVADDGTNYVVALPLDACHIVKASNVASEARDSVTVDLTVRGSGSDVATTDDAVTEAELRAAAGRVLQIAGALAAVRDLTICYVHDRVQFGRPLSALQAVQHQLAALAEEAAACAAAAAGALEGLATDADTAALAVAAAKIRSAQAARSASAIGHQLHGAMGMTHEYSLRLYTTRMWAWAGECGTERQWSERLGRLTLSASKHGLWSSIAPV
jgi:acyl-CoA dehydrogenase